jgi:hypothetical protein
VRKILITGTLLCMLVLLAGTANASDGVLHRPIEDFVNRQGRYCLYYDKEWGYQEDPCTEKNSILIVPPVANFPAWTDFETGRAMSVDFAGLADYHPAEGAFGTTTHGSVTERALPDGRAEVEVRLITKNALTWVTNNADDWNAPLLFGHRADDVVDNGAEPALGHSLLYLKFINNKPPGSDLPDLVELFFFPSEGMEWEYVSTYAFANGPLRELFGVPDGTRGRAETAQIGTPDEFTEERIDLRVLGH